MLNLNLLRYLTALQLLLIPAVLAAESFDPERLEKQVIVAACLDPMQLQPLPDGRLLFIERAGMVKLTDPRARTTTGVGKIPVAVFGEVGLLGLAIDNNFADNGWIYLFFCPADQRDTMRLARFAIVDDRLNPESETVLLEYPIDVDGAIHMGGGLVMDARGILYLGTGDNCPPIPELPVDHRPGFELQDAMRSSANSQDLRGKILRIRPLADGSYEIPAGNLFAEAEDGRAEIYAMGCRNPFRISVDDASGDVYWGDVGPNIAPDLGIGPNGYDEFNCATSAGNFGWPMFVGPNEAYRSFDFATRKPGKLFDVRHPENRSPNNGGMRTLPPPRPAFLWYPSGESERWPLLGSGGRSAMAGPVYRRPSNTTTGLHLPAVFDGRVFLYEWTRNWVITAEMGQPGQPRKLQPFMPEQIFRKPIDVKIGVDGTLYIIEYGDKWSGNDDAQIIRVVYRRGNRRPRAVLKSSTVSGRHPLQVRFDAGDSLDPDRGDKFSFAWKVNGERLKSKHASRLEHTFAKPGRHQVAVVVTDQAGAESEASIEVRVGNEAPRISWLTPAHGSFVDPGQTVRYAVRVDDHEDGSSDDGSIASGRVLMTKRYQNRRYSSLDTTDGSLHSGSVDPGLALMRRTTCFSCHTTKSASAGPSYHQVGKRYAGNPEARESLAKKIITGGAGVWGSKPMPPHPQHEVQETRLMVDWILSLANDDSSVPIPGRHGFFRYEPPSSDSGVLILQAEYTDNGVPDIADVPSIRSERELVLHSRRKRAAMFDRHHGAEIVDVFEGGIGLVARLGSGDWIVFRDVLLSDVDRISWHVSTNCKQSVDLSLRLDRPDGPEIARITAAGQPNRQTLVFQKLETEISPLTELHDLYVIANVADANPSVAAAANDPNLQVSVASLEFHESAGAAARRKAEEAKVKTIVLVPTKLDHPWATHMYADVCRILAVCLNATPGVEAVVSPDLDWPADKQLLSRADAIVYYSRPAADIVLAPKQKKQFEAMLQRGVGFTAIHWSTGAEENVGPRYEEILGGWFNFAFSGLKVDIKPLEQIDPNHPICRGWNSYELRDEFYLNLKFSPTARPVLKVNVDGRDQTVAWAQTRRDGGRSFGTTLGHFHNNYQTPDFRRMLVNGILWTAGVEVPESGATVDIDRQQLALPEFPRKVVREWKYRDLLPLLDRPIRNRSYARGQRLFEQASCAACHRIGANGGNLGPELSAIRQKMAERQHPRGALLREIVEPSHTIDDKYRTEAFLLEDGKSVAGIVVSERGGVLQLVTNPSKPDEVVRINATEIESRRISDVSLMPIGLLNTLNEEEILDLLAYVESGGQSDYVMFGSVSGGDLEPWANADLPVRRGLHWWLDASRLNAARESHALPKLQHGQLVDVWFDASGNNRVARQRQNNAQPSLHIEPAGSFVEFDGIDDYLTALGGGMASREFTAVIRVRPDNNAGWPGLVSANAFHRNDYQSGMNIDLMPEKTQRFETIMTEGKGYIGVINLMRDSLPFGRFHTVTVVSKPGTSGVQLRVNGQPQQSRDRNDELLIFDELTVAARYWCNDAGIPAYNRGFLDGAVSQLLLYDRALSDDELNRLEAFVGGSP